MKNFLILFSFLLCSCSSYEEAIVIKVYDGDTITTFYKGKNFKIRLEGIDAPELKQIFGVQSKQFLTEKILHEKIQFKISGTDRYNRNVAEIWHAGQNINSLMVEKGMAWHYTEYSKENRLKLAQDRAKEKKLGLWKNQHPIPPWNWRKIDQNKRRNSSRRAS